MKETTKTALCTLACVTVVGLLVWGGFYLHGSYKEDKDSEHAAVTAVQKDSDSKFEKLIAAINTKSDQDKAAQKALVDAAKKDSDEKQQKLELALADLNKKVNEPSAPKSALNPPPDEVVDNTTTTSAAGCAEGGSTTVRTVNGELVFTTALPAQVSRNQQDLMREGWHPRVMLASPGNTPNTLDRVAYEKASRAAAAKIGQVAPNGPFGPLAPGNKLEKTSDGTYRCFSVNEAAGNAVGRGDVSVILRYVSHAQSMASGNSSNQSVGSQR